jgi:hypothetical protein
VGDSVRTFRIAVGSAVAALAAATIAYGATGDNPITCDLKAADANAAGPGCARTWFDTNIAINEIQTVGTAESYKQRPSPEMLSLIKMGSDADAKSLDFEEPPLAKQLDANARSLEFDVAYDPKGGLFKNPAGASMADYLLPLDYVATMAAPGFKTIHVLDIDFNSSCLTLVTCLQAVAGWSHNHTSHVPIVITLHTNDTRTPMPGGTRPIPFDAVAFDALDAEILSVFKPDELITPDMVQGTYPTLQEAVAAHNWPKLGPSRGKVMFVLEDTPEKTALYRGPRHSLEGRSMFVTTNEKSPLAAFVTIDDPTRNSARIIADVQAGLMVHTRADSETTEARTDNTLRRDRAFASGAQIVSTNFIYADKRIGSYEARLSNSHRADCDVQITPQRCAGLGVERGNDTTPDVLDAGK